ncbi:MAG: TIR domain-containing protein [Nitrososphaerota archaeon]|nr:TIR domain-containing protein [Nitrososphaerota archaeon]
MEIGALSVGTSLISIIQIAYGAYKNYQQPKYIKQFQDCIVNAWKDTASQQKWQGKAVPTAFYSLTDSSYNAEKLLQIVNEAVKPLTEEDINCFKSNFINQLSKNSNQECYRTVILQLNIENNHLLKSREKKISSVKPDHILTPDALAGKTSTLRGKERLKPKVFISYAWDTEEYQEKVLKFATRLHECGIEVVIDRWSMSAGDDIYAFMERSVNDKTIQFVLLLLDELYAKKANEREGGVGTETQIISRKI